MLEVYPAQVVSNFQLEHILQKWRAFSKMSTASHGGFHHDHTMTRSFFRTCIPQSLHTLLFDHAGRHLGHDQTPAMLTFAYGITEILPGSSDETWHIRGDNKDFAFRYIVPLTSDTPKHGYTEYANHPDIQTMRPGRLIVFDEKETWRERANVSSSSRVYLFVHVFLFKKSGTRVFPNTPAPGAISSTPR